MDGGGRIMQQMTQPVRRDPAPSRWGYRYQRLWLTPAFRRFVRVGLPTVCIAAFAGLYLIDEQRRENVNLAIADVRSSIETRPEFMVQLMAIDGVSEALNQDIRAAAPVDFPISSFDLDLVEMRNKITALPAVKDANLRVRPGGVLQVEVIPRVPTVIWREYDGLRLLDAEGEYVATLPTRAMRPDLPLVAGQGADAHIDEAQKLIAAAAPIADRLRGLVWMGGRRWDVVLDRDQRILLPTENPIAALERVIVLNQSQDMLARDVAVVDMRNMHRPTLRMNTLAVEELRMIKSIESGN